MTIYSSNNLRGWLLVALLSPPAIGATAESDFKYSLGAALGYDDNAYLSPDAPYIDFAAGGPLVTPTKQSGAFADIDVDVNYRHATSGDASLLGEYRFGSDYYFDSALRNANEYKHRFSFGREQVLRTSGPRKDTFYFGVLASAVKDVYFDRDTGASKTAGGVDISDRYSYNSFGIDAAYQNRVSRLQYGFGGQFEKLDYKDPIVMRQYDHNYIKLSADMGYQIAEGTKLLAGYAYRNRDYDERLARDSSGAQAGGNPTLQYAYHTLDVSVRRRFSDAWVAYLDATYQLREDGFVGYNDYDETKFKVRVLFNPSDVWSARFSIDTWSRDYANAFAFDVPGQPAKSYKGSDADLRVEWNNGGGMTVWGGVEFVSQTSSDSRYEYDRLKAQVGAKWSF